MRNRILYAVFAAIVAALAIAPAVFGQEDRAAQVLAASRRAIGGTTLDALKTLSIEGAVVRNINTMQISSDVEILLELPDKYVRTDQPNAPGLVVSGMTTGFNGDRPIQPVQGGFGGGAMVIRMGGPMPSSDAPKLSPEEQRKLEASVVRGQTHELSRLMLGWFAAAHPSLGVQYTFAGEAESPDGRAFVIDAKGADGFAARLFIDRQTSMPLMLTYQGPQRQVMTVGGPGRGAAGGGPAHGGGTHQDAQRQVADLAKQPPVMVDYTLYFEDWQPVDGVRFPRRIRRASGGETTEEWTIDKVKINPKIDAKKFAVKS